MNINEYFTNIEKYKHSFWTFYHICSGLNEVNDFNLKFRIDLTANILYECRKCFIMVYKRVHGDIFQGRIRKEERNKVAETC